MLIIQTDASDLYWGAILKTDINDICRYTSGTFNQVQVNYPVHEKELIAIYLKELKSSHYFYFKSNL